MENKSHQNPSSLPLLLEHPVLKALGCPPGGGGSLAAVNLIKEWLRSAISIWAGESLQAWATDLSQLAAQLSALGNHKLPEPAESDLTVQPWGALFDCRRRRHKVHRTQQVRIDAALIAATLQAAANGTVVPTDFIEAGRTLYRAASGNASNAEWKTLSAALPLDEENLKILLLTLQHKPCKVFVAKLLLAVGSPVPALYTLPGRDAIHEPLSENPSAISQSQPDWQPSDSDDQDALDPDDSTPPAGPSASRFTPGDSIIGWQAKRSAFKRRDDKLGLNSWTTLEPGQVQHICSRLLTELTGPSAYQQKIFAGFALLSLLFNLPPHIALYVPVQPNDDYYLDVRGGFFAWNVDALLNSIEPPSGSTERRSNRVSESRKIFVCDELRQFFELIDKSTHDGRVVADLFDLAQDPESVKKFLTGYETFLHTLGDPAFLPHPSRWAYSMSRIYLQVCHSDLVAATATLDIALVPTALLYYFHPTVAEMMTRAARVYEFLGLTPTDATPTDLIESSNPYNDLHEDLKAGFLRMEKERLSALQVSMSEQCPLSERIGAFNRLSHITATFLEFLTAGRGSKIERYTFGALYTSPLMLCKDDKRRQDGRGQRLVPKVTYLQVVLDQYRDTLFSVAKGVVAELPYASKDFWAVLDRRQLRFDAIAFFNGVIYQTAGRIAIKRAAVTAAHIEQIAQKFFNSNRNFMRHMFVTTWALNEADYNLLRLMTGHSREGLEMPGPCGVYSPASAILSCKEICETLLAQWLPPMVSQPKLKPSSFVQLPLRRLHRICRATRQPSMSGLQGPTLTKWHLLAESISENLRTRLVRHQGPNSPLAELLLLLVFIDGLHDEEDLRQIFSNVQSNLVRGARGWVYSFTRGRTGQLISNSLQAPTATLLDLHPELLKTSDEFSAAKTLVVNWVVDSIDITGNHVQERGHRFASLLSCTALWADLKLPSITQFCYHPPSCAATFDSTSASELLGLNPPPTTTAQVSHSHFSNNDQFLLEIYSTVDRLGDKQRQQGEQKERARLLLKKLEDLGVPPPSTLQKTVRDVLINSIELIQASAAGKLDVGSIKSYLSDLKPNLMSMSHEMVGDFNEAEWLAFARHLKHVPNLDKSKDRKQRQDHQDHAATWFLKSLIGSGYNLPSAIHSVGRVHECLPDRAGSLAFISTAARAVVKDTLRNWHSETPLADLKAATALSLLEQVPMRWGELACLHGHSLLASANQFCIETEGFGHLKSRAANRLASTDAKLHGLIAELHRRLLAMGKREGALFLERRDGVLDRATAGWLHNDFVIALRVATGNPNARVHSLRSCAASNLIFPGWEAIYTQHLAWKIEPHQAQDHFNYSLSIVWRQDEARRTVGHALVRTTAAHYFPAWQPMRALALSGTLSSLQPAKRASDSEKQTWKQLFAFLQRSKSAKLLDMPSASACPVATPAKAFTMQVGPVARASDQLFICLRVAGADTDVAIDTSAITLSRALHFDSALSNEFNQSTVRRRVRGTSGGRARAADLSLLKSAAGREVIESLEQQPTTVLRDLFGLLSRELSLADWELQLTEVASIFDTMPYVLQVVVGQRYTSADLITRLESNFSTSSGPPQRDLGSRPVVYVIPREVAKRNEVQKARLTAMFRVTTKSLLLYKQHGA